MLQFTFFKHGLVLLIGCVLCFSSVARGEQVYQYFGASGKYAFKNDYFVSLLRQALDATSTQFGAYQLTQYPMRMNQSRAIENMNKTCDFDVQWHMTTALRESKMRAIKIPLFKGLYGYRALMIHQDNEAKFAAIDDRHQLQMLTAGQGADWPDTGILKANHFNVYGVANYHALFDLLAQKRIDYFPRSVTEIPDELTLHADKPLMREAHILLYYPAPIYFFVCPDDQELANRLEQGLRHLISSGAFATHFRASNEFQGFTRQGGFTDKTLFKLSNPLIEEQSLPADERLWLFP